MKNSVSNIDTSFSKLNTVEKDVPRIVVPGYFEEQYPTFFVWIIKYLSDKKNPHGGLDHIVTHISYKEESSTYEVWLENYIYKFRRGENGWNLFSIVHID